MSLSMGYAHCSQRRKAISKRQEGASPSETRRQILIIIILDLEFKSNVLDVYEYYKQISKTLFLMDRSWSIKLVFGFESEESLCL